MTDLLTTDTLFMWRFGTGRVCTNLLHIVRLIKRLTAEDNCVDVGLDGVLSFAPQNLAKDSADSAKHCRFAR